MGSSPQVLQIGLPFQLPICETSQAAQDAWGKMSEAHRVEVSDAFLKKASSALREILDEAILTRASELVVKVCNLAGEELLSTLSSQDATVKSIKESVQKAMKKDTVGDLIFGADILKDEQTLKSAGVDKDVTLTAKLDQRFELDCERRGHHVKIIPTATSVKEFCRSCQDSESTFVKETYSSPREISGQELIDVLVEQGCVYLSDPEDQDCSQLKAFLCAAGKGLYSKHDWSFSCFGEGESEETHMFHVSGHLLKIKCK